MLHYLFLFWQQQLYSHKNNYNKMAITNVDTTHIVELTSKNLWGTSGTSGVDGEDGENGTSGVNGENGTSGVDGTSGTSGIDGI